MSTNPVDELGDSTREERPVDNSPIRYFTGTTGIVHRTVRWATCGTMYGRWATSTTIPDGPRCRTCFPPAEVNRRCVRTGWPRDYHPIPETPR